MKKIYIIRHGETTGDLEDRYGGDYDDHLSEKGVQQAKDLSERLKDKSIGMIYHSPKVRAVETAQIVSKILNIPIRSAEDLRERNNYGILSGMVKKEAKEKYPEEVRKLETDKIHHSVTGSEPYNAVVERILDVFEDILSHSQEESLAIISHGGVLSTYLRERLQLGKFIKMGDCSVVELHYNNNEMSLVDLDGIEVK